MLRRLQADEARIRGNTVKIRQVSVKLIVAFQGFHVNEGSIKIPGFEACPKPGIFYLGRTIQ